MIRNAVKNKIYNSLNFDVFRYEDFNIEEKEEEDIYIKINYNNFYYYIFLNKFENVFDIYCKPGLVLSEESCSLDMGHFEGGIEMNIRKWLIRTKNEMLNPVQERYINSKIQNFRKELDAKLNEIEDTFFTKEEGEKLKERLDILEQMISEEKFKNTDLQSEIDKMRSEIEFLKDTVDKIEKKKWIKNAILKIWSWGQNPENKQLIEAGVSTIKTISNMDLSNLNQ